MRKLKSDYSAAGNSQILLNVDFLNSAHRGLLKQAYYGVYSSVFPEEERVSPDLWFNLGDPESKVPLKLSICLAGQDFYTGSPKINGISVGLYYTESQTALIGYNGVAGEFQGKGLGSVMQKALMQNFEETAIARGEILRGIFVEVNDPQQIRSEEDHFDPEARMAIYRRWGAFEVPINYVQPAIEKGPNKFHGSKLLYYPTQNGAHPTIAAVKEFLFQMYKNYGYEDLASDHDFQSMMLELERYGPGEVPLSSAPDCRQTNLFPQSP